jgi:hypothetical protein
VKKIVATLMLSVGLVGCGPSGDCTEAHVAIKEHVEKHIELGHQIDAAGGMSSAPRDLKDAYRANQNELKAAYAHANDVCTP